MRMQNGAAQRRAAADTDDRRTDPATSFFNTTLSMMGSVPGLGLRGPGSVNDGEGGGERKKVPTWWSPKSDLQALWGLLVSSWLNVLLVLVPLGYLSHMLEWNAVAIFSLVRLCMCSHVLRFDEPFMCTLGSPGPRLHAMYRASALTLCRSLTAWSCASQAVSHIH